MVGGGDENEGISTGVTSAGGSALVPTSDTSKISSASSKELMLLLSCSKKLIGLLENIAGFGVDGGVESVGGAEEKLGVALGGVEDGAETLLNGEGGRTTFG